MKSQISNKKNTRPNAPKSEKSIARIVNRVLDSHSETHFYDQAIPFGSIQSDITSLGVVYSFDIEGIPPGTSATSRIGQQICIKHISVLGEVGYPQSVLPLDPFNKVRFIIFYWVPGTISSPTPADILYNVALGTDVNSQYNLTTKSKYRILKDFTAIISSTGMKGRNIDIQIPQNQVIDYQFSSTVVNKNTLWYMAISDSSATPNPISSLAFRVTFSDL
jgi:hypothetical protein